MLFSTLVSYFAGVYILRTQDRSKQKSAMILSIIVDLSLLGFFKYYGFFASNFNGLSDSLRLGVFHFPILKIILPIGISFYTFHTMSYIIDAYRGVIRPTKNFFEFSCYVSLFSQLVAGPIVRFRQIEEDLENIDHSQRLTYINEGISFFLIGLFKKVLIADSLAAFVDPGFKSPATLTTLDAWAYILGYTYQLYFDFSGYSDMAVGLGYLFGIRIPQNFNSPYKALNISDFWRRWHMSLSSWLRDYLYISLGGNRISPTRTRINLMMTMLLGGLWHGANWTFVIWGALHGAYLIIQQTWKSYSFVRIPKFLAQVMTFLAVVVGWVFFRSSSITQAFSFLEKMFFINIQKSLITLPFLLFLAVASLIAHLAPNSFEIDHKASEKFSLVYAGVFIICLFRILANENTPFLYFQF
jgi:alginate O-acetyltransferase complex protein AlgI